MGGGNLAPQLNYKAALLLSWVSGPIRLCSRKRKPLHTRRAFGVFVQAGPGPGCSPLVARVPLLGDLLRRPARSLGSVAVWIYRGDSVDRRWLRLNSWMNGHAAMVPTTADGAQQMPQDLVGAILVHVRDALETTTAYTRTAHSVY